MSNQGNMNFITDTYSTSPANLFLSGFNQPGILADVFPGFQLAGNILFGSALAAIALLFFYHRNNHLLKMHGIVIYLVAFALLCGATFFIDALTFWFPMNWLPAALLCMAGILGWATVAYFIRAFPKLMARKSIEDLESEIALRKNEEDKFRNLLEAAPDATIITNEFGDIVFVNHQLERLFGWSKQELIGKKVEVLVPDYARSRHEKHRIDYLDQQHYKSFGDRENLSALKKDGTVLPVEISISPIKHAEGLWLMVSVRDITFRRQQEDNLKNARNNFQYLVDSVQDYAIFMLDVNGCVTSWNQGAERIKGYSAEEIIGQPMDVFYTPAAKLVGEPWRNLELAAQKGYYASEGWRLRKDGSMFWADVIITPLFSETGNLYGYAKVTRNTTEKKLAEDRMRFLATITDNIHDPIITTDQNNIITRWNEPAEQLLGWTGTEAIGKLKEDILKVEYPAHVRKEMEEALATKSYWHGEVVYFSNSGQKVHVLESISQMKDKDEISGSVILVRDISKRKAAEESLSQINQELEKRVEERTAAIIERENEYRYLFENSPMPMLVLELATFRYLAVNQQALNEYGYTREEFLSMTAIDIRPPEDKNRFIELNHDFHQEASKGNKGIWRHLRKDGSVMLVEIIGHEIMFEGKECRLILSHNVTDKINAETYLKESENRYRSLVEQANDAIILMNPEFRFYDVNPAGLLYTQYTKDEFLQLGVMDVLFEEELEKDPLQIDQLLINKSSFKPRRIRRKDGSGFDADISIKMLENGDFLVLARDITERKEAEQKLASSERRFRALIENNVESISLCDQSFNIIYRSPSTTRMFGTSDDDVLNKSAFMNVHPDDLEEVHSILENVLQNPGSTNRILYRNRHKDGHYLWLEGAISNRLADPDIQAIVANLRDITEKVEAETRVIASERRFRKLIENTLDIMALLDDNLNLIYRSPSASRITGWPDSIVLNKQFLEYVDQEDIESLRAIMIKVKNNPGIPIPLSFRIQHNEGHKIRVEGSAINLLNDEDVNSIVFNLRDVTDRFIAEENLKTNEKRFRKMIENNSDIISLMDAKGKILYRSPSSSRVMGWSKSEMEEMELEDNFHPDDIKQFKATFKEILESPGIPVHSIIRRMNKEGKYLTMEGSAVNLLDDPDVGAIILNFRNVTEKVAAEEKLVRSEKLYRSLFTNMLNGFAYCKAIIRNNKVVDFTFLAVNEEYQSVTGLENISGKNMSDVIPDLLKDDPDLANRMRDAAQYGKSSKFELHVPQLNKWFSISVYSPEKGYFVSLVDNITERKKAEAEINALNEGLEQRVKERTEELESFSYSVSHDLRAPLRAVKGYAKILEEDYAPSFDQEGKRLLGEVQNHAQNMSLLIDELLAFSRLGRKDVNKDRINMEMLIRDIIKEIAITTEIKADIQFGELYPVMADRFLLKHVVMNLLSNALKFSFQEEHPLVIIGSKKENGMITYSIQDNGVGFEMNYQHKLFNLFQRLHTVEEFPGTGVGLSIVQRIIHKHNGKVWGKGKINEGATFFFSLPDTEL
ncbi:MAG TPA: PAS domain S-box protein [Catalimonadaceae bacterium]|nr:PAS domain S-box protein [Catalimonadaceae bacterium]